MGSFVKDKEEALLELQTRRVPMVDGGTRELTYTVLVWRAMDYLLDRGYLTIEELVWHAQMDGWEPPNAPFEMRFSSVVAYWTKHYRAKWDDYDEYCRGEL